MNFLREFRNEAFGLLGKRRFSRILICSFTIATIWTFADFMSDNYMPNPWHDFVCLGFGIVAERMLPWGKGG